MLSTQPRRLPSSENARDGSWSVFAEAMEEIAVECGWVIVGMRLVTRKVKKGASQDSSDDDGSGNNEDDKEEGDAETGESEEEPPKSRKRSTRGGSMVAAKKSLTKAERPWRRKVPAK